MRASTSVTLCPQGLLQAARKASAVTVAGLERRGPWTETGLCVASLLRVRATRLAT